MFPIRCFTCGKVIGNMWAAYTDRLREGSTPADALAAMNVSRMCCRRMFLSHIDLDEKTKIYNRPSRIIAED